MVDLTITERKEPFTLDEVFSFIDNTSIGRLDACELKSRIVDVVLDERNKALDCFIEKINNTVYMPVFVDCMTKHQIIEIAEQLKEGGKNDQ